MSEKLTFRTLTANEIEARVGNVAKDESGFFLLLYKNARVDANILDETVGSFNWQSKYYQVKNTMVCSVGIWNDARKEWVWKDNGGDDDTQMEQVKAELSDAFKRACFNWGIGRELYYSPKIYVKATSDNSKYSRYSVKVIEYNENKRITKLVIINDKTKEVVFSYGLSEKVSETSENTTKNAAPSAVEEKGSIEKDDLVRIQNYIAALASEDARTRVYNWLDKYFKTMNPETLTRTQGKKVVSVLVGGSK